MRNARAHKLQWSGPTVHSSTFCKNAACLACHVENSSCLGGYCGLLEMRLADHSTRQAYTANSIKVVFPKA